MNYFIELLHNPKFYSNIIWQILLLCVLGLFLFFLLIILLDTVYRPNIPQYPFNIFLDRIIPLILLYSPLFISISNPYQLEIFWAFLLGIGLHCFLVVPIMYLWSKHRNWSSSEEKKSRLITWSSPIFYYYLAIALIYPLIWGLYFSISRYLRLGVSIDPSIYFAALGIDFFAYLIASAPLCLLIFLWFLFSLNRLRTSLWDSTSLLLYSFHLHLLRFDLYFHMAKLLYKMYHLIFVILTGNDWMYVTSNPSLERNRFQSFICYLYFHSYWLNLALFCFILSEFIFTGKLFYSFYILFWYILLLSIFRSINAFADLPFVLDCCLSDYINYKWNNPRFPVKFWVYLTDPDFYYGFNLKVDQFTYDSYKEKAGYYQKFANKHSWFTHNVKVLDRVSGITNIFDVSTGQQTTLFNHNIRPWFTRFKASFKKQGFRWFHASSILRGPLQSTTVSKIHPLLYHNTYIRTLSPSQRIIHTLALYDCNVPQANIDKLQKEVCMPTVNDLYIPRKNIFIDGNIKTFSDIVEGTVVHSLTKLTESGVVLGTFNIMKKLYKGKDFPSMQQRPDVALVFQNSTYAFQDDLGVDCKFIPMKYEETLPSYAHGRNQIITSTVPRYLNVFESYLDVLSRKKNISVSIMNACTAMKETLYNFDQHLDIWAKSLHLFDARHKPPIFMSQNLPLNGLKKSLQFDIIQRKQLIRSLNRWLYENNVPEDTFDGSHIQKIMSLEIEHLQSVDFKEMVELD